MDVSDLIFVGLSKVIVALRRDTGQIVWQQPGLKRGYATLLLDGDRLIVSVNGYLYCLHPLTGQILWHNPLTGLGLGIASIVSSRGRSSEEIIRAQAEADAQAAASSSSTT